MNRVQAILVLDDLAAGVDDLERLVDDWIDRVHNLIDPAPHVRITFLTATGEPPDPDPFRMIGFTQELGEAPVIVDEFLEAP